MSRDGHYIVSKSDSDKIDKAFDKMAKEIAELQRAKEELLAALKEVRCNIGFIYLPDTNECRIYKIKILKIIKEAIEAHK